MTQLTGTWDERVTQRCDVRMSIVCSERCESVARGSDFHLAQRSLGQDSKHSGTGSHPCRRRVRLRPEFDLEGRAPILRRSGCL
ncbi:hypothetical protein NDU88_003797 [Pleurodeles waltl]|uniref:Uncharacterized protein n=1 Tax=Pleurodeles waltl TaxID=8319 RepID=A0AAV7KZH3_PLEWA|nr:hypothetical protein NDU88_003797 [Pleurodeles waltl]